MLLECRHMLNAAIPSPTARPLDFILGLRHVVCARHLSEVDREASSWGNYSLVDCRLSGRRTPFLMAFSCTKRLTWRGVLFSSRSNRPPLLQCLFRHSQLLIFRFWSEHTHSYDFSQTALLGRWNIFSLVHWDIDDAGEFATSFSVRCAETTHHKRLCKFDDESWFELNKEFFNFTMISSRGKLERFQGSVEIKPKEKRNNLWRLLPADDKFSSTNTLQISFFMHKNLVISLPDSFKICPSMYFAGKEFSAKHFVDMEKVASTITSRCKCESWGWLLAVTAISAAWDF